MRQGLDLMTSLGVPVETVVASGGATRHPLWLQLQADIYDRPIRQTETAEAAATGAAMLAGVGAGVFADAAAAIEAVVRWRPEVVEPLPERVATYERHYDRFRALYPALVDLAHGLDDRFG
jgi:xylulokinase